MTQDQLIGVVQARGYETRIRKQEVIVKDCWFCGNPKWNLELNADKGVFRCWACKAKGRLDELLNETFGLDVKIPVKSNAKPRDGNFKEQHDIGTRPVREIPTALDYLARRGITETEALRYEISVCIDEGSAYYARLMLPVREFWTQTPVGFVARGYNGERPKYLAAVDPPCVVGYKQARKHIPYVLLEGALDAIAVHRAGFNTGALLGKGFADDVERWAARVPPEAPVVVMLDGDAQADAQRLAWRAKAVHPRVTAVLLPPKLDPAMLEPLVIRRLVEHHVRALS